MVVKSKKNNNIAKESQRILIVDDEDQFRTALSKQLSVRGYDVHDVSNGDDAVKFVRHQNPKVVILDQKMPGMDGVQTLKELKKIKPEIQVIMLTGHGSTDLARITGRLDVFKFLEKPVEFENLIKAIDSALKERVYAMARYEIAEVKKTSIKEWLIGVNNARPGVIILGFLLFLVIVSSPTTDYLYLLLNTPKTGELGEQTAGYSDYKKMKTGQTVAEYYLDKAEILKKIKSPEGSDERAKKISDKAAFRAKVMVGLLVITSLFWATGAIPIGVTALLVGAIVILFGVFPPNTAAKTFAKDSVIFVFGVLTIAAAISKTRLDRRIGILLLGSSKSLAKFAFIFAPLLAVSAGFLSEHALVAFLTPILLLVYISALRAAGLEFDHKLCVFMFLLPNFCANIGGPGSPAAGGRNAVMLGIFTDYGIPISFGQWVKFGLPYVPVAALALAFYFYFFVGKRSKIKNLDIASYVQRESKRIGKMTKDEYKAATILILLVTLWITMSDVLGMGGPVLICIVLLNILGILTWQDIKGIHWDVVALYAAASAMGDALASSGAALWLAGSFVSLLPEFMKGGIGLCVSASLMSGILTNIMSDGATVAVVGPVTVPMAILAGSNTLMITIMVGLATAFASSFANCLIIGTPNNAIVYSMARHPDTGEQLITMKDFLKYGTIALILDFIVLWFWCFMGYWQWISL